MDLKFKIAKLVAGGAYYSEHVDYEGLIEAIYENRYRAIDKCPVNLYLLGIVESFVVKDIEHANKLLNTLKEVTQDILEVSGIELTFTDEDWNNLKFITNPDYKSEYKWSKPYNLPKMTKGYMAEFFEN